MAQEKDSTPTSSYEGKRWYTEKVEDTRKYDKDDNLVEKSWWEKSAKDTHPNVGPNGD